MSLVLYCLCINLNLQLDIHADGQSRIKAQYKDTPVYDHKEPILIPKDLYVTSTGYRMEERSQKKVYDIEFNRRYKDKKDLVIFAVILWLYRGQINHKLQIDDVTALELRGTHRTGVGTGSWCRLSKAMWFKHNQSIEQIVIALAKPN